MVKGDGEVGDDEKPKEKPSTSSTVGGGSSRRKKTPLKRIVSSKDGGDDDGKITDSDEYEMNEDLVAYTSMKAFRLPFAREKVWCAIIS